MNWDQIALILLASGTSSRFEDGDKLLAPFQGEPLIRHAGGLLSTTPLAARIAVVGKDQTARQQHVSDLGWGLALNAEPELGLSQSLTLGMSAVMDSGADAVLILLADMPCVGAKHLEALKSELVEGVEAAMSDQDGILCPPAIFARRAFASLLNVEGDRGARHVFEDLNITRAVPLSRREGLDVDRRGDLLELESLNAGG